MNMRSNTYISDFYAYKKRTEIKCPLYLSSVYAGSPLPADDYVIDFMDLNDRFVKNSTATYFVRVQGDSMIKAGIHSGDILIVDRSLEPVNHKIVIASMNGEFTVKRMSYSKEKLYLQPENDDYDLIEITEEMDFRVWGVVTFVIHKL